MIFRSIWYLRELIALTLATSLVVLATKYTLRRKKKLHPVSQGLSLSRIPLFWMLGLICSLNTLEWSTFLSNLLIVGSFPGKVNRDSEVVPHNLIPVTSGRRKGEVNKQVKIRLMLLHARRFTQSQCHLRSIISWVCGQNTLGTLGLPKVTFPILKISIHLWMTLNRREEQLSRRWPTSLAGIRRYACWSPQR